MYSLYITKYAKQGAKDYFPLPKVLGDFMYCTDYSCDLLISPGYMSRSKKTIEKFLDKIETDLATSGKKPVGVGLFHGMNGHDRIMSNGPTVLDVHSQTLKSFANNSKYLEEIKVLPKGDKDHRKMIFFFERNHWDINSTLNDKNIDEFLYKIRVRAVLIGSSNFSWTTYYDAEAQKVAKGESDLLMFTNEEKNFIEKIQGEIGDGQMQEEAQMILFQSIAGGEHPEDFFYRILKNFLEHSLR